jgi:flagellar motility protein MotE (MotC chaperone)
MPLFLPFSNSSEAISFRSLFWIPSLLLGITLLLGFRFYEKSSVSSTTILSGASEGFLQAAAEPDKSMTPPAPTSGDAASQGAVATASSREASTASTVSALEPAGSSTQQAKETSPLVTGGGPAPVNSLTAGTGSILKPDEKPPVSAETVPQAAELDILNLTTEEVKILQSLAARRGEIEKREKSVLDREHLLDIAEKRIDQKVQEMQKIRDILKLMTSAREAHEKERMRGLVKIYELMKPDKAALIFEGLELDVLLEMVDMMKEVKLSPILSAMNPRAAQKLTAELAAKRKFTEEISQASQKEEALKQRTPPEGPAPQPEPAKVIDVPS